MSCVAISGYDPAELKIISTIIKGLFFEGENPY